MTVSTGSSRSSAPAETIGWTWRIIPIPTTALPTATTQTGRQSSERQPAGPALPETSAHPTTPGHPWDTAHLLTTRQITRAHRNKSGAAARHNRSCLGLLVAAIDSATQQMPYRNCGLKLLEALCISQFSMAVISSLQLQLISGTWEMNAREWFKRGSR